MSSTINNRHPYSPSPIYGIHQGFSIADVPQQGQSNLQAITDATTTTTSSQIAIGVRTIEIDCTCEDSTTTFDVTVLGPDNTTVVIKWTGQKHGASLYIGTYEGISLDGNPFYIKVDNFSAAKKVNVYVKRMS